MVVQNLMYLCHLVVKTWCMYLYPQEVQISVYLYHLGVQMFWGEVDQCTNTCLIPCLAVNNMHIQIDQRRCILYYVLTSPFCIEPVLMYNCFVCFFLSAFNLVAVAAHEIGHSLGLAHSNVLGAIMYPVYFNGAFDFKLHPDDILGIESLYGKLDRDSTW